MLQAGLLLHLNDVEKPAVSALKQLFRLFFVKLIVDEVPVGRIGLGI